MNDKFWYLKSCELFERLTPVQIQRLEARARSRKFERKSLVYVPTDAGDSVMLLTSGRVKIYHLTSDGKQALLAIIDPGEMFGELAMLDSGEREEFAETMEASSIVLIPGSVVQQLMEESPQLSLGVTKMMGLRRRRVERRLKSLLFRSNRERLIHLLLELVEKYGQRTDEGIRIGIKLSHQDLASIIGSTRETVTVVLGELQTERNVIIKRRQIILTRPKELAAGIGVSPPPLPQSPSRDEQMKKQPQFGS